MSRPVAVEADTERKRCGWCGKPRTRWSEWEQETLGLMGTAKQWKRLCNPCANRRLNNPYNALLGMRKIGKPSPGQEWADRGEA